MKNKYKVLGLMSGTSLDGLDIAYCEFVQDSKTWKYKIHYAETVRYPRRWANDLSEAAAYPAEKLLTLHAAYGAYLGNEARKFVTKHGVKVDFIASHGHTIFHQPANHFTFQLGDGNALHAESELPVIYDFRSLDVQLGGQGAPLVPVGDKLLFSDYDVCLNLGGIANLSMDVSKSRVAFDVCFCNMGFNYLMHSLGKQFDKGGELAASGIVNDKMLKELTGVYDALRKKKPSLGREIFEQKIRPILDNNSISVQDKLATAVESTASEIIKAFPEGKKLTMLCTGGGAFNSYLMSRILHYAGDNVSIVIPDDEIVNYKEALIFAFLGVLRLNRKNNCLRSVTGASRDSSGGVMIGF